jgi:hypothetical protein
MWNGKSKDFEECGCSNVWGKALYFEIGNIYLTLVDKAPERSICSHDKSNIKCLNVNGMCIYLDHENCICHAVT